jgi:hypothetical protein
MEGTIAYLSTVPHNDYTVPRTAKGALYRTARSDAAAGTSTILSYCTVTAQLNAPSYRQL